MAEEKKTVSPEEKLLKVIQEDGKQAPRQTPEEKLAQAVKPQPAEKKPAMAEAAKTPVAEKPLPKLKPSTAAEKKTSATADAKSMEDKAAKADKKASVGMIGATPAASVASAVPQKRQRKESFNLAIINRGLAALIIVALVFAGLEIYGAVRGEKTNGGPVVAPDFIRSGIQDAGTVSLADARKAWAPSPWGPIGDGPLPPTNSITHTAEGWMQWVKDNWKLMGVSRADAKEKWEVVIHDKEKNGLLFMKIGDVFKVQRADVKLDSIEDDRIRLHDGKKGMDLK